MTQQYTGGNNVTISMRDGGSVPIVSQTEIDPMKTALPSCSRSPRRRRSPSRCPCRSRQGRAARARMAISHRARTAPRRRLLRTPSPSRRTVAARGDGLRRAPTACEMDARGSSLRAGSIFQSPEFRTPPCLTVGATVDQCTSAHAQPGDKVVGAWPRDRLVAMDATFCARVERTIAAGDESRQGSLSVAAIPAHVAKGTMTR